MYSMSVYSLTTSSSEMSSLKTLVDDLAMLVDDSVRRQRSVGVGRLVLELARKGALQGPGERDVVGMGPLGYAAGGSNTSREHG